MKEELKIGDCVEFEGINYRILLFHKGFGNSEVTATLVDDSGNKRDVLKRILVKSLEEEKIFVRTKQRIEDRVKFEEDIETVERGKRIRRKKDKDNGLD
jgi:hypothetical protein